MKKYDFIERSAFFSMQDDEYAACADDAPQAEAPAAEPMEQAEAPAAEPTEQAEAPAAEPQAEAPAVASRPTPMKPRSPLVAALNEKGVLVLSSNNMLSDVPEGVRSLALFMAENFDGIAPLLTALRSSYCIADPGKRGRFWYVLREEDDPELLAELMARLEYAGCLNECKITRTVISGRLCLSSVVNTFVIGRHAEIWSHSVTRDVARRLASRLGTDWEVLSNAILTLPGGERAEADELLRVGGKVFCVEVKTQQKNVDLDRFHHVGGVLTGNDPSHLLLLHMRANDEQLEMLRYFHRFHAANSRSYAQALERMILAAHDVRTQDAA